MRRVREIVGRSLHDPTVVQILELMRSAEGNDYGRTPKLGEHHASWRMRARYEMGISTLSAPPRPTIDLVVRGSVSICEEMVASV